MKITIASILIVLLVTGPCVPTTTTSPPTPTAGTLITDTLSVGESIPFSVEGKIHHLVVEEVDTEGVTLSGISIQLQKGDPIICKISGRWLEVGTIQSFDASAGTVTIKLHSVFKDVSAPRWAEE